MSENKQDTITVELPIEAEGDWVHVAGVGGISADRDRWRRIAAGGASTIPAKAMAPAVVEWIERDEWEPLDVPEVGRKIRATLRDGHVETFEVRKTDVAPDWASVWKAGPSGGVRYIQRVRDVGEPSLADIIDWEYVDEAAVDLAALADKIAAAVNELREAIG